ncbi:universal stress protein [Paraburkholderia sp. MM5384-R2]|uniref:universal stress protein n=1 Tax=Paraburkholderia sp. MM5384-R2 TaxID=2723097 RepID=UPI00160CD482|nr:universal stress protein [Paraburkholderia sp. MM5384-R2]
MILQPAHEGDDIAQAIGLAAREWRADLLVIGTRGARLTGKWRFASVAEQVAALAVLPMLLMSYSPADRWKERGTGRLWRRTDKADLMIRGSFISLRVIHRVTVANGSVGEPRSD